MARMLGHARYRPADPRDDGLLLDSRTPRQQQRARERQEAEPEMTEHLRRDVPDPFVDPSDCEHGCNGSPCGSERCTFMCHDEPDDECDGADHPSG